MDKGNLRKSARVSSLKNKTAKTPVASNKSSNAGSTNRNSAPRNLTSIESGNPDRKISKTSLSKMKKGNERIKGEKNPMGSDQGSSERVESERTALALHKSEIGRVDRGSGYLTRSNRPDSKKLESENVVKEISKTALGKRKSESAEDKEIPSCSAQLKEISKVSKLGSLGFIGKRRIYTLSSIIRKKEEDKRLERLMESRNSQCGEGHNVEPVASVKKITQAPAYKALFCNQPKKVADQDESKKFDVHSKSSAGDGSSDRTDGDDIMRRDFEYPRTEKEQLPELKEATNPSLNCVSDSSQKTLEVESNRVSKKRKTAVCNPVCVKLDQDDFEDNTNQLQGRESTVLDGSHTNPDSDSQVEQNSSSAQNHVALPPVQRMEWIDLSKRVHAFQQEVSKLCKTLQLSNPNKDATTDRQEQVSDGTIVFERDREDRLKVPETSGSNDAPKNLVPRGESSTPSISERTPNGDALTMKLENHPRRIESSLPCPSTQDARLITTAKLIGQSPTYYCPVDPLISDKQVSITEPIEKLQPPQPMSLSVNVPPSARCANLPVSQPLCLPSSGPEHHAVSNRCSVEIGQPPTQLSVNLTRHVMNPVTSEMPRIVASSPPDPLQYELTRIRKEMDNNAKNHEATKMQLAFQFKKETEEAIQQIRQKYKVKYQAIEAQLVSQRMELDRRFNMVLNHQLLANSFHSKCVGSSRSTSSFPHYHMT